MKQVSVIIPTFNRKNELKKSVESVLQQTFRDFELIIMDDGSSDGTNEMIDDIHDKRIRYIKLEENHGVSVARNEGVRRAECKWIAFQDSDDYWLPQKLEKQWNYHEQFKEYNILSVSVYFKKWRHDRDTGRCAKRAIRRENFPIFTGKKYRWSTDNAYKKRMFS